MTGKDPQGSRQRGYQTQALNYTYLNLFKDKELYDMAQ